MEIIKEILDFKGYFISNLGKVYCNLGKGNRDKNKTIEMYELRPRLTKNGYARIYARQTSTGKRKDLYIHRLVAETFLPNPQNKKYVNHINCIRDDNKIENLEWCTAKENIEQTEKLRHVIRNKKGRFVSNFTYSISDCIVYSPDKYRETEGIKDIGTNFWDAGRTQEIKERYVHLGGNE